MRLKLDENLGDSIASLIRGRGHDVESVASQHLLGCPDKTLIELCNSERRTLVSLDKEFGSPLIYPPHRYAGVVLIRLPSRARRADLDAAASAFLAAADALDPGVDLTGKLWIAQPDRVREYRPVSPDDADI